MMVYRLEHRQQRFGPYIPSLFVLTDEEERLRGQATRNVSETKHPNPRQDGLGDIHRDEFCCFASLDQVDTWFDVIDRCMLDQAGFGLFSYQVDESLVRHGRRQSVFRLFEAVRLDEVVWVKPSERALAGASA